MLTTNDDAKLIETAMRALETTIEKPAREIQVGDVVSGVGCLRTTIASVSTTKRGLVRTVDSNWGVRFHNAFDIVAVVVFS